MEQLVQNAIHHAQSVMALQPIIVYYKQYQILLMFVVLGTFFTLIPAIVLTIIIVLLVTLLVSVVLVLFQVTALAACRMQLFNSIKLACVIKDDQDSHQHVSETILEQFYQLVQKTQQPYFFLSL